MAQPQKFTTDKKFTNLIAHLKASLGQNVKDIRLTSKLTDSPACLVADKGDMDVAMENLMKQRDPNYQGAPRILEINPEHALVEKMNKLLSDKKHNNLVDDAGTLLFEQARMMEGKLPSDPTKFAKIMNKDRYEHLNISRNAVSDLGYSLDSKSVNKK